jgi:hypothetical protein
VLARRQRIGAQGRHEGRQVPGPVDRHEARAHLVGGGVQGDREVDLEVFAAELLDARHETDRRDGDPARRVAEAELGVGQDLQRLHDFGIVRERLAHAHEDQMCRVLHGVRAQHLAEHLGRREIARESHRSREAERARIAAADLGRQAERDPSLVRHEHARHAAPIGEAKHELAAAVL